MSWYLLLNIKSWVICQQCKSIIWPGLHNKMNSIFFGNKKFKKVRGAFVLSPFEVERMIRRGSHISNVQTGTMPNSSKHKNFPVNHHHQLHSKKAFGCQPESQKTKSLGFFFFCKTLHIVVKCIVVKRRTCMKIWLLGYYGDLLHIGIAMQRPRSMIK